MKFAIAFVLAQSTHSITPAVIAEQVAPAVGRMDSSGPLLGNKQWGTCTLIDSSTVAVSRAFAAHGLVSDVVFPNGGRAILDRVLFDDREADLALISVDWKSRGMHEIVVPHLAKRELAQGEVVSVLSGQGDLPGTLSTGLVGAVREVDGSRVYQLSGGIPVGIWGAPTFNSNGELVGLVRSAEARGDSSQMVWPIEVPKKREGVEYRAWASSVETDTEKEIIDLYLTETKERIYCEIEENLKWLGAGNAPRDLYEGIRNANPNRVQALLTSRELPKGYFAEGIFSTSYPTVGSTILQSSKGWLAKQERRKVELQLLQLFKFCPSNGDLGRLWLMLQCDSEELGSLEVALDYRTLALESLAESGDATVATRLVWARERMSTDTMRRHSLFLEFPSEVHNALEYLGSEAKSRFWAKWEGDEAIAKRRIQAWRDGTVELIKGLAQEDKALLNNCGFWVLLADAIFESSIDSCSELLRHAEPEDLDQSQRSKIEEAVECLVRAAEIQGAFVPREEFGLPAYLNLVDHRIPHLQILLGRESEARAWWRNTCDSARGKEIVYRVGMSKFGEFDASSLVQLHVDAGVFWRSIDLLEAEYHVRKASEEVDRLERAGKDSTGDRECVAVVARYIHSISK